MTGGDLTEEIKALRATLEPGERIALSEECKRLLPEILLEACAVVVVDLDAGVILWATPSAAALFGYMTGELTGRPLSVLIPDRLRPLHEKHVEAYNEEPSRRPMGRAGMTLTGRCRDGSEIPVEIGLFPRAILARRCGVAVILRRSA